MESECVTVGGFVSIIAIVVVVVATVCVVGAL
ncbi:hypothetical protein ABIC49_005338 [Burkholderia ambifaria]